MISWTHPLNIVRRTPYRFGLILGLLWCATAITPAIATVQHDEVISVGDADHYELGGYIGILEDPSGELTLDDARARLDEYIPSQDTIPNFGQSQSAYWLHFSLSNSTPKRLQWYLRYAHSMMDEIDFYSFRDGQFISHQRGGRLYGKTEQGFPSRHATFPVELNPHETRDYFLRVTSGNLFYAHLILLSDEAAVLYERKDQRLLGYYYGIIASIFVFSLFLAAWLRQKVYYYYLAVIVLHHFMTFICVNGIADEFLGLHSVFWQREGILVFLNVALIAIGEFSKRFLNIKVHSARLAFFLSVTQCILAVVATLPFWVPFYYASTISTLSASLMAIMMLLCCLKSVAIKEPGSKLFLAGWVTTITGGLAYALIGWRLMPVTPLTEHAWQIGSAIEALLLSAAIADRIRVLSMQKEFAQKASAAAKEELLQVQIEVNADLDRKVRERTQALEAANEKLQRLSTTDELTQLRNRRYFNERFQSEFLRAYRDQTAISVLLFDIDHFKSLNDRHGHPFGDRCLIEAAILFKANIRRPGDTAARYGGEEFVAVLPNTDLQSAVAVAQNILAAFRQLQVDASGHPVTMTVSIGVASTVPAARDGHEELLQAADSLLYQAKEKGRNRIEFIAPN
ncbi:MAG: diguanylate cyclase [Pseudomonadota bacterium]|nr:diguanylate cyclase [Pseudomonadota bacterium]